MNPGRREIRRELDHVRGDMAEAVAPVMLRQRIAHVHALSRSERPQELRATIQGRTGAGWRCTDG